MSSGHKYKYVETIPLNDLTHEQFLVLANQIVLNSNWPVQYINDNGLVANTNNGYFNWNAEIIFKIEDGVVHIKSSSEVNDSGENKRIVLDIIYSIEALNSSVAKEEINAEYLEIEKGFHSRDDDRVRVTPYTFFENIKNYLSVFKPTKEYFITPILLNINIFIFVLMVVSGVSAFAPNSESLLLWGANFRTQTLAGEWWRLITCCFIHIGIFHLFMNMFALIYIGALLERHLGKLKFISAYILAGIVASVTSLCWHDFSVSAGASGAIFGMYGVFLALLTTNFIAKSERKSLLISISFFVGYNLIFGLKAGVDNAAHIGGLISGVIIGYAFIPSLKKSNDTRLTYGTIGLLVVIVFSLTVAVIANMPNDIGLYQTKIAEFTTSESKALEVYSLPSNTSKDSLLIAIQDRGIFNWEKNIKLIDSFEELDLPLEIRTQNRLLKEYCELRMYSYELWYKEISENTDQYRFEIDECNKQIEEKIHLLGGGK
jgi:rhomboid protease GluP